MDQTKHITSPVVNAAAAVADPLAKAAVDALVARRPNDEGGRWIYATREIVDSMQDIIRVDGVSTGLYHDPPASHLKILAQHLRSLGNGEVPVVARVTDTHRFLTPYKGKMVKTLALYAEWLRDGEGNLLKLANHYREMVEAGGIDSVSVGVMVREFEWMKDEDGHETYAWDITASDLYETSYVTIPANASATVVRDLELFAKSAGYEFDADPRMIQREKLRIGRPGRKEMRQAEKAEAAERAAAAGVSAEQWTALSGAVDALRGLLVGVREKKDGEPYDLASLLERAVDGLTRQLDGITSTQRTMADRLEVLESAVTLLSTDGDTSSSKANPVDNGDAISRLAQAVRTFSKTVE